MMTSLSYWLLSLALFLGLWGCAWSISVEKRRRKERGDSKPIITMSERLKQKAHTIMTNTAKIGLGVALGVGLGVMGLDWWQSHHLGSVSMAVVENQQGNYVTYHFLNDPKPRDSYAFNFCPGRYLPHFQPRQIIKEMRYVRVMMPDGGQCEDLTPPIAYLQLWRVNGVPILEEGGD